jgi:hypothetical protein
MQCMQGDVMRSPRTNLHRVLDLDGDGDDGVRQRRVDLVKRLDAENKLRHRKLYLVLDLDETLVYSQRMDPAASPRGTRICVRGSPFDMVPRPGLANFLQVTAQNFVIYLYTMGDEEYTRAVLDVIDPASRYFTGAPLPLSLWPRARAPLPPACHPSCAASQAACAAGGTTRAARSRTCPAPCASPRWR